MGSDESATSSPRPTGEPKNPDDDAISDGAAASIQSAPAPRDLSVRIAELAIFLTAIVGAVALGLGITDYFASHPYVTLYLTAYGAFRVADLLVREDWMLGVDRTRFASRVMHELPVLLLFAAAPFERTYLYATDAPRWIAGLGLLIELTGLWLALGARIQLGFFSAAPSGDGVRKLVRSGFYRYLRHPIYAGEFLVLFAWPFEYGAPITGIVTAIAGIIVLRRRIREDETEMLALFGDEYAAYMRATDAAVPGLW
jgi:protein-S-isoprenylcysteine O-methyltransferase Ste14